MIRAITDQRSPADACSCDKEMKKGHSREKTMGLREMAPFVATVAAKNSLSITKPALVDNIGSPRNRLVGSKGFLRTIANAIKKRPDRICQTDHGGRRSVRR